MADEQNFEQLVDSYRKNLDYDAKDDDLVSAIDTAMADSKVLKGKMDERGRTNKTYWKKGTMSDDTKYHPKKSRVICNRIFADIETMIPIITSETPEPTVVGPGMNNDVQFRVQKGLNIAYEVVYKMKQKTQQLIRHWFLNMIGIMKYRWDTDGFTCELVLARKVGFDPKATSFDNCGYFWEEIEIELDALKAKFPKKEKEIEAVYPQGGKKSKVYYIEFWGGGGEWYVCKLKSKSSILSKKKNPNFDYKNPENNIFKKPKFPYLIFNVMNLGDDASLYDDVGLIEVAASIQEDATKTKRQISDLNEGQKRVWTVSAEAMSEEEAQKLVDKTGDFVVRYDRKAPANALTQVQSGKPDASLFNNLDQSLSEIDNILGAHSTTRGERGQQETLGGRKLLMGSDYGRLDMIVQNLEDFLENWYNAYLHMIKVYADQPVMLIGAEDTVEIKPEEIPSKILIMVKKGSTLPIDRRTKREEAIQLSQIGSIDPGTLFEEMGYPNVQKRVADLYKWLAATGKINPQALMGMQEPLGQGLEKGLQNIQQIMKSPEFEKLPPEEQMQFVKQAKGVVQQMKGQGVQPQGGQPNAQQ